MKQKKIITQDFFIGNLGNIKSTDEIRDSYLKTTGQDVTKITNIDTEAAVSDENFVEYNIRKCHVSWMNVSESNFIETGLKTIIENVNTMIWKKNLDHVWQSDIQFTKYIGRGEHYDWHQDTGLKDIPVGFERKLSIVYCLSKKTDYTGGEFQIKTKNGGIYSTKFDYGDFIVFPSEKFHRVKPLKSGVRITMVGWYR